MVVIYTKLRMLVDKEDITTKELVRMVLLSIDFRKFDNRNSIFMDFGILYKYLNVNGALSMLRFKELQFTNATKFNDPFDCHPSLIDCSNPPEKSYDWPPKEFQSAMAESRLLNNCECAWISCLSKRPDNILMWSYYTKHSGVCLGLAYSQLKKYLNVPLGMMTLGGIEVMYRDIVNKPDYFRSKEDYFTYQLGTKAMAWEHEQEVRFVIIEPSPLFANMKLPFKPKEGEITDWKEVRAYPHIGPECFKSVYLGVNLKPECRQKIIDEIRASGLELEVYQMTIDPDRFELKPVRVYTDQ